MFTYFEQEGINLPAFFVPHKNFFDDADRLHN